MEPCVSIVVCTHNRANILKNCLESLADQAINENIYEVIIIDNSSTDNTFEISQAFIRENLRFRYIYESEIGVSHARNRGWREAKGDYVAYIDDDGIANPNWLVEMFNFINRFPDISIFGGPYKGYTTVQVPKWFPPDYGSHSLGDEDRLVNIGKEWIGGANIVFRKEVLNSFGGFDTSLGPKGDKMAYGEDTRLIKDLYDAGYDIYYVSKMKIKHLIREDKMSLWWFLKKSYIKGLDSSRIFNVNYSLLSCFKKFIYNFWLSIMIFFSYGKMPFKRRIYYSFEKLFRSVGILVGWICYRKQF